MVEDHDSKIDVWLFLMVEAYTKRLNVCMENDCYKSRILYQNIG